MPMHNVLMSFFSRDWAGLALAAIPAAVGVLVLGGATPAIWLFALGYATLGIAALMALGSARHLMYMARVRRQYPPPGRLVDVGGYRMHVLAEGNAHGRPTLVWMPGGHGCAFSLYHLHRTFREETRSVLIDRPGQGWSDIGPFPRTTAGEAVEIIKVLENAGEQGPFVFVGHSFGGLLVANVARRRPDITAGVVLLDATPPDTIIYGPRHPLLSKSRMAMLKTAMLRLFGMHQDLAAKQMRRDAFDRGRMDGVARCLGPEVMATMEAIENGPRASLASASIFRELSPTGMAEVAWQAVVYDGDLGDLPLFLVAPGSMSEGEFNQVSPFLARIVGEGESVVDVEARARRIFLATRERYLAASTRSERIYTPEGTTHFFVWEKPEFVADVLRRVLSITA